ncbi:MAG: hypothetical protein BAJATHORv1_90087 [Candidatus Thorarchaeota archaeon]|nr:MAG: hypothetical protein BAJATHORv1_90087 [Candidatus Thorarchaeota archaeon]
MLETTLYHPSGSQSPPLTCVSVSPSKDIVAVGTLDAQIILFNTRTRKLRRSLKGHEKLVSSLMFLDGGDYLLSSSWDGTTKMWSSSKKFEESYTLRHSTDIKVLAVDSTFSKGVAGTRDGLVKLFSLKKLTCIRNLQFHQRDISGLAFYAGDTKLITTSWSGKCNLWDLSSYDLVETIFQTDKRIRSLTVSPDDTKAALGLHDGTVVILDLIGDIKPQTLDGHNDVVGSLAFNPSDSTLLTSSWDTTIRLWSNDFSQYEETKLPTGVTDITWDQRGKKFFTSDFSGSLKCWTIS